MTSYPISRIRLHLQPSEQLVAGVLEELEDEHQF